jgi:replication-associated recombination protein RarA
MGVNMFKAEDWKLKYRPNTLDEVILPEYLRKELLGFKSGLSIQNLLFHGAPGKGKTSCSMLLRDSDLDIHFVNCSINSSVDNIKALEGIGSSMTFTGNRRLFVLDEVEKLSKEAFIVLRGLIEKLSVGNDFILTANDISKIDKAVISRLNSVNFDFEVDLKIRTQIKNRFEKILMFEGIELNPDYSFDIDCLIDSNIKHDKIDLRLLIGKLQSLVFRWKN